MTANMNCSIANGKPKIWCTVWPLFLSLSSHTHTIRCRGHAYDDNRRPFKRNILCRCDLVECRDVYFIARTSRRVRIYILHATHTRTHRTYPSPKWESVNRIRRHMTWRGLQRGRQRKRAKNVLIIIGKSKSAVRMPNDNTKNTTENRRMGRLGGLCCVRVRVKEGESDKMTL